MTDPGRRGRARPPAPAPRDGADAPEADALSPLAAFLDDAEAALCELREADPPRGVSARERSE